MARQNILTQMFDIRPLTAEGALHAERILSVQPILRLHEVSWQKIPASPRKRDLFLEALMRKELRERERVYQNVASRLLARPVGEGAPNRGIPPGAQTIALRQDDILEEIKTIEAQDSYLARLLRSYGGAITRVPRPSKEAWERFQKMMLGETYEKEWATRRPIPARAAQQVRVIRSADSTARAVHTRPAPQPAVRQVRSTVPPPRPLPRAGILSSSPPHKPAVTRHGAHQPALARFEACRSLAPPQPILPQTRAMPKSTLPATPLVMTLSVPSLRLPRVAWRQKWLRVQRRSIPFLRRFGITMLLAGVLVEGVWLVSRSALSWKAQMLVRAHSAQEALVQSKEAIYARDFARAHGSFERAAALLHVSLPTRAAMRIATLPYLSETPGIRNAAQFARLHTAVSSLAHAGEILTRDIAGVKEISLASLLAKDGSAPTELLARAETAIAKSLPLLEKAYGEVNRLDERLLPAHYHGEVQRARSELPRLIHNVKAAHAFLPLLREAAGGRNPRQYLLLFQNTDEKRATGGFLGSYGVLTLSDGRIRDLTIHNIFDIDGQLPLYIAPPRPLQSVTARWETHDANWFFDFPSSAKKTLWFYEKTGEPTPDGIIAITPRFFTDLLRLTGAIPFGEYGMTITAENFIPLIQAEVESDAARKTGKPKQILADFAPVFMERLSSFSGEAAAALAVLTRSLAEKDIQLYFNNPDAQRIVLEKGWGGAILDTPGDYLAIVHSNVNGYKTDRVIDEEVTLESELAADGSAVNTLTITKTHRGGNTPYEFLNKPNKDYLRVYVPHGSQLLDVEGNTPHQFAPLTARHPEIDFEADGEIAAIEHTMQRAGEADIMSESGKTVFGAWFIVSPGDSRTITFRYRTSRWREEDAYRLYIQKQAGSTPRSFVVAVRPAGGVAWSDAGDGMQGSLFSASFIEHYGGDTQSDISHTEAKHFSVDMSRDAMIALNVR